MTHFEDAWHKRVTTWEGGDWLHMGKVDGAWDEAFEFFHWAHGSSLTGRLWRPRYDEIAFEVHEENCLCPECKAEIMDNLFGVLS